MSQGCKILTVGDVMREAVKKTIKEKGYDGLVNLDFECGCGLEDLEPCGAMSEECVLGYKGPSITGEFECCYYETKGDRDNAIAEVGKKHD